LTPASTSNTLSCLLEMPHSKQAQVNQNAG
jgi:hypothetical protein